MTLLLSWLYVKQTAQSGWWPGTVHQRLLKQPVPPVPGHSCAWRKTACARSVAGRPKGDFRARRCAGSRPACTRRGKACSDRTETARAADAGARRSDASRARRHACRSNARSCSPAATPAVPDKAPEAASTPATPPAPRTSNRARNPSLNRRSLSRPRRRPTGPRPRRRPTNRPSRRKLRRNRRTDPAWDPTGAAGGFAVFVSRIARRTAWKTRVFRGKVPARRDQPCAPTSAHPHRRAALRMRPSPGPRGSRLHQWRRARTARPAAVTAQATGRIIYALFEGLTAFDRAAPRTPASPSAGRSRRTDCVTLFTSVRTRNGAMATRSPRTDFAYSWKRTSAPETAAEYSYQLHYILGARDFNEGKTEGLRHVGVRVIDRPHTRSHARKSDVRSSSILCAFSTLLPGASRHRRAHSDWAIEPLHFMSATAPSCSRTGASSTGFGW